LKIFINAIELWHIACFRPFYYYFMLREERKEHIPSPIRSWLLISTLLLLPLVVFVAGWGERSDWLIVLGIVLLMLSLYMLSMLSVWWSSFVDFKSLIFEGKMQLWALSWLMPLLAGIIYWVAAEALREAVLAALIQSTPLLPFARASLAAISIWGGAVVLGLIAARNKGSSWLRIGHVIVGIGGAAAISVAIIIPGGQLLYALLIGILVGLLTIPLRRATPTRRMKLDSNPLTASVELAAALTVAIPATLFFMITRLWPAVTLAHPASLISSVIAVTAGILGLLPVASLTAWLLAYSLRLSVANTPDLFLFILRSSVGVVAGLLAILGGLLAGNLAFAMGQQLLLLPWPVLVCISFAMGWCLATSPNLVVGLIGTVSAGLFASSVSMSVGFLVGLAFAIGYFRIVDYLLFALHTWYLSMQITQQGEDDRTYLVKNLPPKNTELLWFPLPGYERILLATLPTNPQVVVEVLSYTMLLPVYGFQIMLTRHLPRVVAELLKRVETLQDIERIADANSHVLGKLLPDLYPDAVQSRYSRYIDEEIVVIFPCFIKCANKVQDFNTIDHLETRQRKLQQALAELDRRPTRDWRTANSSDSINEYWNEAASHWKNLVVKTQQDTIISTRSIRSPFEPNKAIIKRFQLFKGRRQLASQISDLLRRRSGAPVILHGPRRCGKTSFLYNLPRFLDDEEIIPVIMDLQDQSIVNSEGDFWYSFMKRIDESLNMKNIINLSLLPTREQVKLDTYPVLEDWLRPTLKCLGDRQILLLIDEFERLGDALLREQISERIFDQFRHFIQHTPQLSFLLAGMERLEDLGPGWSSYFINSRTFEITHLSHGESRELLLTPDTSIEFEPPYSEEIVDKVVALTNGHPYLVQLMGDTLIDQVNAAGGRYVDEAMLELAIQSVLTRGIGYFDVLWKGFMPDSTRPNSRAGAALIRITEDDPFNIMSNYGKFEFIIETKEERRRVIANFDLLAWQQALKALASGHSLEVLGETDRMVALARLQHYHIIRAEHNKYTFEVPLVARWVRERAIPSSILS
jgi:hypothetical protein